MDRMDKFLSLTAFSVLGLLSTGAAAASIVSFQAYDSQPSTRSR